MTPYTALIKAFVALSAPDQSALTQEPGPLEFTVDDQTCTVFPFDDGAQLVLQSEVKNLGDLDADRAAAAYRLLHSLNWAAAVRTGIVALVDDQQQVLVSRVLETSLLDAPALSDRIAQLLQAASRLRGLLNDLPVAPPAAGGRGIGSRTGSAMPDDSQLV